MSVAKIDQAKPRPFFRFAGGKRRLAEQICSHMPTRAINTYCEPFLGGGAVFWYLVSSRRPFGRAVLSDTNFDLVSAWGGLKTNHRLVESRLRDVADLTGDAPAFYDMRARPTGTDVWLDAARFLYLQAASFNGLWRVNSKGQYNTPHGGKERVGVLDVRYFQNLQACARVLEDERINIWHEDFEIATRLLGPGDVAYFDPPYLPTSETADFTAYSGRFGIEEQRRLLQVGKELAARGCWVGISNSDSLASYELYAGCRIVELASRSAISASGDSRKPRTELLVLL